MYILALHEDSNANITILKNNEVIFAIAEERLSRKKHQAGFPLRAINYVRDALGIPLDDISVVVCGNKYHPLHPQPYCCRWCNWLSWARSSLYNKYHRRFW